MTSQTAHTKYKWPPYTTEWKPHENFLRTPLGKSTGKSWRQALQKDKLVVLNQVHIKTQKSIFLWRPANASMYHTQAVACRGLVKPGATSWLYAPLPNSRREQRRMVVIVTAYTLFVTSHYDVIFTFANQCFGKFVDKACILFYTHSPYSLLYSVLL